MESFKTTTGPERHINYSQRLRGMLRVISGEINEEAQKDGLENLVEV
jgi:hypothetical protein